MLDGVKQLRHFLSASPWDGYFLAPHEDSKHVTDEASTESYLREQATAIRHPTGTVAMGSEDSDSPLNADLTLKGVTGLRIVDASVFVRKSLSIEE